MNKFTIISIISFTCGILAFGAAGYCYWIYLDTLKLFAYYGIPETSINKFDDFAHTINSLKFGIIKFSVVGIMSWLIGLFFIWKRFKKL